MPRIHTDIHFIRADNIPAALKLLLDAGLISESRRDVHFRDISGILRGYPDARAVINVQSIY